ncbi:hypothetical protein ACFLKB_12620 [Clostridium sp. FAM 1755]
MLDLKANNLYSPSLKYVVMFNAWRAMSRIKHEQGSADIIGQIPA